MWEILLAGSTLAALIDIWFFGSLLIRTKRRFVHILLMIYSFTHLGGIAALNIIYSDLDYRCLAITAIIYEVFMTHLLITAVIAINVALASFDLFPSRYRRNIQRLGYIVILTIPAVVCAFFIGRESCDIKATYIYAVPFFVITAVNLILLVAAVAKVQSSGKINIGDKRSHYTFYALLSVNMGIYRFPAVITLFLQDGEISGSIDIVIYFFYITEGAVIAAVCSYHYKLWKKKEPDQIPNDGINSFSMSSYSGNNTMDGEYNLSLPTIPREVPLTKAKSNPLN